MKKKKLELLYRSFDRSLSATEQKELTEALDQSESLKNEQKRVASMRERVARNKTASFEPFFSSRVMERIKSSEKLDNSEETSFLFIFSSFKRMAIAGAAALLLLCILNLTKKENSNMKVYKTSITTIDELLDRATTLTLEEIL